ncbi:carbonic anhydrase 7-like [Haliotis cracherodii]|uniref:carbonic anhydrase 7-like n=1 Tax=Haliotis cracherodii TaxID=6455 RepID=UPI0039E9617B
MMGGFYILTISFVVIPLVWDKTIAGDAQWGYFGNIGPSRWTNVSATCGGSQQSPINIQPKHAKVTSYDSFTMHNYDITNVTLPLKNTGHTAQLDFSGAALGVSGGGLSGDYTTAQLHFHWGKTNFEGSEHTLDGKTFPMELHIVNYKTAYGTLLDAVDKADGLAVWGFFFKIGDSNQTVLDNIINALPKIVADGTNTTLSPFKLEELLPSNVKNFYRYAGSLTSPYCNESVIWTLFTDTINITASKMEEFRKLQAVEKNDNNDYNMYKNFRPTQSLGGRVVYSSFEPSFEPNAAERQYSPISLSLLALAPLTLSHMI